MAAQLRHRLGIAGPEAAVRQSGTRFARTRRRGEARFRGSGRDAGIDFACELERAGSVGVVGEVARDDPGDDLTAPPDIDDGRDLSEGLEVVGQQDAARGFGSEARGRDGVRLECRAG